MHSSIRQLFQTVGTHVWLCTRYHVNIMSGNVPARAALSECGFITAFLYVLTLPAGIGRGAGCMCMHACRPATGIAMTWDSSAQTQWMKMADKKDDGVYSTLPAIFYKKVSTVGHISVMKKWYTLFAEKESSTFQRLYAQICEWSVPNHLDGS